MTTPIPRWCIAGTLGRCRVLSYHKNGYFFILGPGTDIPYYRHRSSLVFIEDPSPPSRK